MLSYIADLDEYASALQDVKVPYTRVDNAITRNCGVQWDIARLDLLDKELSGNKLFKLLPFLQQARAAGITQLLSFGGMHSNHLHALAYAGKRFGFSVVAVVRGYAGQAETPTLQDLRALGVQVILVGNTEYRLRYNDDYLHSLQQRFPLAMIIPEGGFHPLGVEGARLMGRVVSRSSGSSPDILAMALGTGTGFAGVLTAGVLPSTCHLLGYSALKNAVDLRLAAANAEFGFAGVLPQWQITDDYCIGGFAGLNRDLALFIARFESEQDIPLDPVYTAKLCFAIEQQIDNGNIPAGSRIVALHTGGLQGRRGMQEKLESYGIHESMGSSYRYA